ncbi:hypothetical protein B0H14DRAFT_2556539 [Mycena olivaceomarginata]|nr:hypothetical protein B0H14DRAFT_2556539 [Mycena olivaceomarginata]
MCRCRIGSTNTCPNSHPSCSQKINFLYTRCLPNQLVDALIARFILQFLQTLEVLQDVARHEILLGRRAYDEFSRAIMGRMRWDFDWRWCNKCIIDWRDNRLHIVMEECKEGSSEPTGTQVLAPSISTTYAPHGRMSTELQTMVATWRGLLSQCPDLFRVLQARRLLFHPTSSAEYNQSSEVRQIRIVLDLSWDDIQRLCPEPIVSRDLAGGSIRLMQQIESGNLPMTFWSIFMSWNEQICPKWGRHIRSSPQCDPELLQELDQFIPPFDVFSDSWNHLQPVEFHDVVQWLKASYDPRPDLIRRWEGYLRESMVRKKRDYNHQELEERWQDKLAWDN